jgi:glyoxylase-like metal-dependent hydrolase (beta-lactamase superfamily II)
LKVGGPAPSLCPNKRDNLDVRRARKGDCLIVHYCTKSDPGFILIDGGPSQVYRPHLKPRLAQIRKARKLAADQSLPVDLLMVSHIDDDHINGILDSLRNW